MSCELQTEILEDGSVKVKCGVECPSLFTQGEERKEVKGKCVLTRNSTVEPSTPPCAEYFRCLCIYAPPGSTCRLEELKLPLAPICEGSCPTLIDSDGNEHELECAKIDYLEQKEVGGERRWEWKLACACVDYGPGD